MAGFRLTTKVQVSGWRFLLRRVEHAIVRRDTRMFDDPLQFYSRAVSLGIVIAVLVCLGAALLAYFKPLGKRGGDSLLVDRSTNQLYVVMPGNGLLQRRQPHADALRLYDELFHTRPQQRRLRAPRRFRYLRHHSPDPGLRFQ